MFMAIGMDFLADQVSVKHRVPGIIISTLELSTFW
jgi:hypothetical protein